MTLNGDHTATRPTINRPDERPDERPDGWITPQEAAEALGISVEAIRGRVKRNTLPHRKDRSGAVWVRIRDHTADQTQPDPTADQTAAHGDHGDQTVDQTPVVEVLREQVAYLKEQVAAEREAHGETRRIAAMLAARVGEIEARQDTPPPTPQAPQEAAGDDPGPTGHTGDQDDQEGAETERRSWWRRLLGLH